MIPKQWNGIFIPFRSAPLHFVLSIKTEPKGYNSNLNLKIIFNWNFLIYFCVFLGSLSQSSFSCYLFHVTQLSNFCCSSIFFKSYKVCCQSFFSFHAICTNLFFFFSSYFQINLSLDSTKFNRVCISGSCYNLRWHNIHGLPLIMLSKVLSWWSSWLLITQALRFLNMIRCGSLLQDHVFIMLFSLWTIFYIIFVFLF